MARKKKTAGKYAALGAAFLAAVVLTGYWLEDILRYKWNYEEDNAAQQIVQGYYEEDENTLDVLYLGASTVRNAISPLEMWADYGFTGYSRATSIQTPVISWYLLLETLERQKLKAVVVDATPLFGVTNDDAQLEGKIHEAIDYMRLSPYKIRLVQDTAKNYGLQALDFYSLLYRYHDRWEELEKQDFAYRAWGKRYPYKGQYPVMQTVAYTWPEDYMQPDGVQDSRSYLSGTALSYFDRMIELCKKKRISFVLIKTPVGNWDQNKHEMVAQYAQASGVDFLDFCMPDLQKEIGFDEKTDFCDNGRHPNVTGGKKISRYLGGYLKECCDLKDKREDAAYRLWWEDYALYEDILEDEELLRESDFFAYLEKLRRDRYVVMAAAQNDTAKYFSDEVHNAMKRAGLQTDLSQRSYLSYGALIDGGAPVWEERASGEAVAFETQIDGHSFAVGSFADAMVGNYTSFLIDGEQMSLNKDGLTFVVYDKVTQQVISRRNFNMGRTGSRLEDK